MGTLILTVCLVTLGILLFMAFLIRSFGNISCRRLEKKLLRNLKKDHQNLKNLLREYRFLIKISSIINSKKYTIYYDKTYWNEVIDSNINEISNQSFRLFSEKIYSTKDYVDLQSFLNMISYNAGAKPELIENFVKNYKSTLITEIIAKETSGYEEMQKEIFSETLKHQINFSLQ